MKNIFWVIDRFEGEYAVLENADTKEITDALKETLPGGAKEGDALAAVTGGGYKIDGEETARRKERVKRLLDRIKNRR